MKNGFSAGYGLSLAQVPSPRPATKRILVEVGADGKTSVRSTLDWEETSKLLQDASSRIQELNSIGERS